MFDGLILKKLEIKTPYHVLVPPKLDLKHINAYSAYISPKVCHSVSLRNPESKVNAKQTVLHK